MKQKLHRMLSVMLLLVCTLSVAAQAAVYADKQFRVAEAFLTTSSSSLRLDFTVSTNTTNAQVGIETIKLHDLTTGRSSTHQGSKASGLSYSAKIPLPAVKGHRYDADVTFYADGLTKVVQTDPYTF